MNRDKQTKKKWKYSIAKLIEDHKSCPRKEVHSGKYVHRKKDIAQINDICAIHFRELGKEQNKPDTNREKERKRQERNNIIKSKNM